VVLGEGREGTGVEVAWIKHTLLIRLLIQIQQVRKQQRIVLQCRLRRLGRARRRQGRRRFRQLGLGRGASKLLLTLLNLLAQQQRVQQLVGGVGALAANRVHDV